MALWATPRLARRGRRGWDALAVLALVGLLALPVEAVGVRPLVIDLELRAGETAPFELILSPSDRREQVRVRLFQPRQLPTGDLTYVAADPHLFPPAAWIQLEQETVEVPPGQEVRIPGRVSVPFGVSGSYPVVLMVEPVAAPAAGGVTIQVRYAVRLNLRITGVGPPARAEVVDVGLTSGPDGHPWIGASVLNPSTWDYRVEVEAVLRDGNRRLVARLPLQTEQGRRSGHTASRIYPGSRLEFTGRVEAPLASGAYELQVFARYGDGRQAVARSTVHVGDDVFTPPETRPLIEIDESGLELHALPGSFTSTGFTLVNRAPEPVVVAATPVPAGGDAADVWTILRPRSPFPVTLRPGQSRRVVLSVQTSRDQAQQGYYGFFRLQAWPEAEAGPSGPGAQEIRLPVAVIVGEVPEPVLELGAAQYVAAGPAAPGDGRVGGDPAGSGGTGTGDGAPAPGNTLFVAVHNAGLRHAVLEGNTVTIEDGTGAPLASHVALTLPSEPAWLLPGAWGQLEAGGVPALPPGRYTLLVTLRSPEGPLGTHRAELVVPEEVGP